MFARACLKHGLIEEFVATDHNLFFGSDKQRGRSTPARNDRRPQVVLGIHKAPKAQSQPLKPCTMGDLTTSTRAANRLS